MGRALFRYEKGLPKFDEIDRRGFITGENRASSSAFRRIANDYSLTCACVYQFLFWHADNESGEATVTADQVKREITINRETAGHCFDLLTMVGFIDCIQKGNSNVSTGEKRASIYKINNVDIVTGKPTGRYNPYPDYEKEHEKIQAKFATNIPINEERLKAATRDINGNKAQGLNQIEGITEREINIAKQHYVDRLKQQYNGKDKSAMVRDLLKMRNMMEYYPQFDGILTDYGV